MKGKNVNAARTSRFAWPLPIRTRPLSPPWSFLPPSSQRCGHQHWRGAPSFQHTLQIAPPYGSAPSLLTCAQCNTSMVPDVGPPGRKGGREATDQGVSNQGRSLFSCRAEQGPPRDESIYEFNATSPWLPRRPMKGKAFSSCTSPCPKEKPFNQPDAGGTATWKRHRFKGPQKLRVTYYTQNLYLIVRTTAGSTAFPALR